MGIVSGILVFVLSIYLVLLIGRMIFETVQAFARQWRPTGIVLVLAEAVYTVTDPPLKFLRRFIPPLRLGTVAFDLSFTVLFIVVLVLIQLVSALR
ncbi:MULTISPECIES: YggT family protein [Streptosporangium]|uniref:YggT family protein n=1 Tax=Streptosporangium amethystogenes subsp. fukuiense TaxID=698418 RepID=A0ABW2T0D1_9ACTN|nr:MULTISPECIES: YggT family protein [Streptosporangium]WSA22843.1 YggT family protein [Streptosporangium sp. NBC_01810]WSC99013.1 YggT family protein [Streptosporangium sp. NBC_01755]